MEFSAESIQILGRSFGLQAEVFFFFRASWLDKRRLGDHRYAMHIDSRLTPAPSEPPRRPHRCDLQAKLDYLIHRFDREYPPDRRRLSAPEEVLIEAVEKGPSGLVGYGLRKWFETGDRISDFINTVSFEIYWRFKQFFPSARHIAELAIRKEEPPKQLPPASDEGA